jgi:NAD(P)-dependent dehydrogenase (short-subunit alcohol dehydrogenase family)/acyl dehydratase/acyl carrier protein
MPVTKRFEEFQVGDHVWFARRFGFEDFEAFAGISGDRNPLHSDSAYAAGSEFGAPVVPLHLVAAPLSRIAGMALPGDPSMYLGHDLRALSPVFYGEEITFSARVTAVNQSHRVLTLSVIAFRGTSVVLEGFMKVCARVPEWIPAVAEPVRRAGADRVALVTGATGAVGSCISLALARAGWDLLLHYRSDEVRAAALADKCRALGVGVSVVRASLSSGQGSDAAVNAVRESGCIALVVHAASPAIDAGLNDLVACNFVAFQAISQAALPAMLQRQWGRIVFIGSAALEYLPAGCEHYVAAKSMAVTLVAQLHRTYGRYGIRALALAPGYIRTAFSERHRPANAPVLLPEEVAEQVVACLDALPPQSFYASYEPGVLKHGKYGFHLDKAEAAVANASAQQVSAPSHVTASRREDEPSPQWRSDPGPLLAQVLRHVLRLSPDQDVRETKLGVTEGWDSLRHIELLLEVERVFGLAFSSEEMAGTHDYAGLELLVHEKLIRSIPDRN